MSQANKRELWIDALRGLAMLMVVLGHSLAESIMYHSPAPDRIAFWGGWIDAAGINNIPYNLIASVYMPLFAFVSGAATSGRGLRITWPTLLRRAKQLLVPYFAWPILVLPLSPLPSIVKDPGGWLDGVIRIATQPSALWFLYAIFVVQVLIFAVTRLSENPRVLVISAVVAIGVRYFLPTNFLGLQQATMLYPFFCLGMLERQYGFLRNKRWLWAALVAYPATLALTWPIIAEVPRWWPAPLHALLMRVPLMPSTVAGWTLSLTHYSAGVIVSAAGIVLLYHLYLRLTTTALEVQAPIGLRTVGIYATHQYLLYTLVHAGITSATLLFLISGSVSFILTLGMERVPVVSDLLLGKPSRRRPKAPAGEAPSAAIEMAGPG